MCMKMQHMVFLDSVYFLPRSLRKLPEASGLTASKSYYPHYFKTEANLDNIDPSPAVSNYGARWAIPRGENFSSRIKVKS